MKTGALMICAVIVLLLLPAAIGAIQEFRTSDYVNEFIVPTGPAETSVELTLSQSLHDDDTRHASIISDNSSDAPIAWAYSSSTTTLTVNGLAVDDTRRLTITYKISALDSYFGADIAARVWPMLLVVGVIGIIVAAVYNATHKGD